MRRFDEHTALVDDHCARAIGAMALGTTPRLVKVGAAIQRVLIGRKRNWCHLNLDGPVQFHVAAETRESGCATGNEYDSNSNADEYFDECPHSRAPNRGCASRPPGRH